MTEQEQLIVLQILKELAKHVYPEEGIYTNDVERDSIIARLNKIESAIKRRDEFEQTH